jgi:hypothetical protein
MRRPGRLHPCNPVNVGLIYAGFSEDEARQRSYRAPTVTIHCPTVRSAMTKTQAVDTARDGLIVVPPGGGQPIRRRFGERTVARQDAIYEKYGLEVVAPPPRGPANSQPVDDRA